jgi:hypothetical protein
LTKFRLGNTAFLEDLFGSCALLAEVCRLLSVNPCIKVVTAFLIDEDRILVYHPDAPGILTKIKNERGRDRKKYSPTGFG